MNFDLSLVYNCMSYCIIIIIIILHNYIAAENSVCVFGDSNIPSRTAIQFS